MVKQRQCADVLAQIIASNIFPPNINPHSWALEIESIIVLVRAGIRCQWKTRE